MRKFYETVYTVRVLSEEPIPEGAELEGVLEEANTGSYVARVEGPVEKTLTEPQVAELLYEFGSEPDFFQIEAEDKAQERGRYVTEGGDRDERLRTTD